jgi:hypothetical protein
LIGVGLLLYTAVVFGFFETEGESRLFMLFLLALPIVGMMLMYPRAALITMAVFIYFVRWMFDAGFLPREATWITDILILLLVIRTFLLSKHKSKPYPVEKLIFLFLAFALLTSLVNSMNLTALIAALRLHFRYLLLFVAATRMDVSRRWLTGFVVFLFVIGLVQTPITLEQYYGFQIRDLDDVTGSFGYNQTPGVAMFLLVLFTYLIARMVERAQFRLSYIVMSVWMSVGPILGEAKFYFLFLPVLLLFMIRQEFFRRPAVSISLGATGLLLIVVVNVVILRSGVWQEGRNPLTYVTKLPQEFQNDVDAAEYDRFERGFQYVQGTRLVMKKLKTALIGNGAGAITDSYIAGGQSPTFTYYSQWSLTSAHIVAFMWLLIEFGVIGIAILASIMFVIYRRGRFLRKSSDPELRIMGRMLEGLTFLYCTYLLYTSAWQTDSIAFVFWGLAGLIVHFSYQEELAQKAAAVAEPAVESASALPFSPGMA